MECIVQKILKSWFASSSDYLTRASFAALIMLPVASEAATSVTHHTRPTKAVKTQKIHQSNAAVKADLERQLRELRALADKVIAKYKQEAAQNNPGAITGRGVPNVSISSPNALGGAGVSVFAAAGYVNHWEGTENEDGFAVFGASFGNPYKYVGVVISTNIDSVGVNEPFGQNGAAGFRINRYLTQNTALAGGVATPARWGTLKQLPNSYYGVITHNINTKFPIALNFGLGSGAFNSIADAQAGIDNKVKPFGGVAITVYKGLSFVVDDTNNRLNVGGTYLFNIKKLTCFVTPSIMNAAQQHDAGAYFMINGGLSYAFS